MKMIMGSESIAYWKEKCKNKFFRSKMEVNKIFISDYLNFGIYPPDKSNDDPVQVYEITMLVITSILKQLHKYSEFYLYNLNFYKYIHIFRHQLLSLARGFNFATWIKSDQYEIVRFKIIVKNGDGKIVSLYSQLLRDEELQRIPIKYLYHLLVQVTEVYLNYFKEKNLLRLNPESKTFLHTLCKFESEAMQVPAFMYNKEIYQEVKCHLVVTSEEEPNIYSLENLFA